MKRKSQMVNKGECNGIQIVQETRSKETDREDGTAHSADCRHDLCDLSGRCHLGSDQRRWQILRVEEDAISRRAQAERERQARVILGESEKRIAASFAEAPQAYMDNPTALHLRAINMLFEGLKEKGALVIGHCAEFGGGYDESRRAERHRFDAQNKENK
jgi:hypothetical protein